MTEQNRQFDDLEAHVPDRLRRDLGDLFQPPGAIPAQVDKSILDQARRRLAKPRPLIVRLRWAAGIGAVAAVIILGFILFNPQSAIKSPQSRPPALAEGRADIDGNGRVDILDAFRLARRIESRGPADPKWDLNGDGRIDRDDVDLVAAAAVRLGSGAQARRGDGILPWRREAHLASLFRGESMGWGPSTYNSAVRARVPPSNRGQDARDTQGQDALATSTFVDLSDQGVRS